MTKKIIFLGNGPLADAALATLKQRFEIVFHARSKADLTEVARLKRENPELSAILASFGVLIREPLLDLFEPEGILNIHPSLLPKYRGPSPIESAILAGDQTFGVSVMKLTKGMDAGPIYWQGTIPEANFDFLLDSPAEPLSPNPASIAANDPNPSPIPTSSLKQTLYHTLATAGAAWLCENLEHLPTPVPQDDKNATYTEKLTKSMGNLDPKTDSAAEIWRKIVAFQGFPKPKYAFFGQNCILLDVHPLKQGDTAPLTLTCADDEILAIDRLQPEGRKPMDAKSFLNGYGKR